MYKVHAREMNLPHSMSSLHLTLSSLPTPLQTHKKDRICTKSPIPADANAKDRATYIFRESWSNFQKWIHAPFSAAACRDQCASSFRGGGVYKSKTAYRITPHPKRESPIPVPPHFPCWSAITKRPVFRIQPTRTHGEGRKSGREQHSEGKYKGRSKGTRHLHTLTTTRTHRYAYT